jgi:hypothetical protein
LTTTLDDLRHLTPTLDDDRFTLYTGRNNRPQLVPFETPSGNLSVEELKLRYGISKQTLYSRKNAGKISGIHIKGRTYFTPEEVWCFDKVAELVEKGLTLPQIETLVREWRDEKSPNSPADAWPGDTDIDLKVVTPPPTPEPTDELVEQANTASNTEAFSSGISKYEEREDQARQLARAFTTAVGQALQETREVVGDPLRIHRILDEAAKNDWVLSGTQLGEIFGLSTASITKWRPYAVRNGFVITAIAAGLWEVKKASREVLLEHAVTVVQKKATPDDDA